MPGFWMHETSGVLKPAVMAYLSNRPMTDHQLAAMRAYLRQWMDGPWTGVDIDALKARIETLDSRKKLHAWFEDALDFGIDPL